MSTNPLLEAALAYAARGWPVFPCNPRTKRPLLGRDKDGEGKPIPKSGGLTKASTDPEQVAAWWKQWPNALVAIATGHPTKGTETAEQPAGLRMFVLDFDPREDANGEIFELHGLKRETEAAIGCELPISLAHLTPSDGVHLYLLQGDTGTPINNRGNLPDHVDVRGLGGYVIAPPSVMSDKAEKPEQSGKRYRVHRKQPIGGIALAPAKLLEKLREKKDAPPADPPASSAPDPAPAPRRQRAETVDEDLRNYAESALEGELKAVRTAQSGSRNAQLNNSALKIASLVAAGVLEETSARSRLEQAARDNPGRDDDGALRATIESGWSAGINNPRDLKEVASAIRERHARRGSARQPSNRPPARPPGPEGKSGAPFRIGSESHDPPAREVAAVELEAADKARLKRIAQAWISRALEALEELDVDEAGKQLRKIAFGAGARLSIGILEEHELNGLREASSSLSLEVVEDVERAIADGIARGFDPRPVLLDLKCAGYPLTDFGLAERFRDRFGTEFRFTTAKGWLGWDGRRWKVLDQDQDTLPAELITASFDTIRGLQREGRRVAETGVKHPKITIVGPKGGEREDVDESDPAEFGALDRWQWKGRELIRFSEILKIFGRSSEVAGKPASIATLARKWLTVPIEAFDCEQMAVNVQNGTLRFTVERLPDGTRTVAVALEDHRREDLITRIAPVAYDAKAAAELYDASIAWAQPDPATRRYVHQVGGYAITGLTGEHKLWFNYGRGRNGKSVAADAWCSALGDYSGTIGIESFLDQGVKKRGDAASPDLAKLGGVRMLRASEPERGAKLNAALIKAATGGEPMSVRALHRGFFDLNPRFKLIMAGNSKPAIPDTDDGIWTRMKLVPWRRNIDKPELDPFKEQFPAWHAPGAWPKKDTELLEKIKAHELAGVFRRLVEGLVDYLEHGFVESSEVTLATDDYREKSDPLGRFLRLCTAPKAKSRVKSSELHACFEAWCKAAGEKPWSAKGFADAMEDKGFTKVRSDGMRWEGIELIRQASDFVDDQGNVREKLPDLDADPDYASSSGVDFAKLKVPGGDDDDVPAF